jgi:hypothetical protein
LEGRGLTSVPSLGVDACAASRNRGRRRASRGAPAASVWLLVKLVLLLGSFGGCGFPLACRTGALLLLYPAGKRIVKFELRRVPRCSIAKPASGLAGSGPKKAVVKDANPTAS